MNFRKGDQVVIIETGQSAVVADHSDPDLVEVSLDGQTETYFAEDICLADDFNKLGETNATGANKEADNSEEIYLIINLPDDEGEAHDIFPIGMDNLSSSSYSVTVELQFSSGDYKDYQFDLGDGERFIFENFVLDKFNESPQFIITYTNLDGQTGKASIPERTIRIKKSDFIKKLKVAKATGTNCIRLPANPTMKKPEIMQPSADDFIIKPKIESRRNDFHDSLHFPREIDLHVEQLDTRYKNLSNAEILRKQMLAFEQYLREAIRLKIGHFFVIHGVGKGILREAVCKRLKECPEVDTFVNEFHHKYEFGATEVRLKE